MVRNFTTLKGVPAFADSRLACKKLGPFESSRMASTISGISGRERIRPTSEMTTENARRTSYEKRAASKAIAKDQPAGIEIFDLDFAGDFFQPGRRFFDLDSLHAQVEEFLHGDGAAAVGHGDDHAMDFLALDHVHQVDSHRLARHRAFQLARPAGDLDADFRILPQALHQALRALAGAENIDALDQNGQLDQPGKTDPPSE